tara:strand:+ start:316 stop:597 length:282 start_codon:yes stop_codon:yes gene_type:complete
MNILRKKEIIINKLVKKALKDKFISKPPKGYKYLKDLKIGSLFEIPFSKIKGILIECETNAKVIITENGDKSLSDSRSLGKKTIASKTEVKEI